MNENYQAMTEGILHFLQNLGLPQYYEIFVTKGFDMETDLLELNDSDLDEMRITHKEHRAVLKSQASKHILTPEYILYVWLKENGLDYYFVNFINSELIGFEEIAKMELPDEKIYDELEIMLPGHKKRLRNAVKKLRKKRRATSPEFEAPVTEGWWGKPEFLKEAKYDFLCVDALLSSTKANSVESQRLQFMVDSGSDVVTVRQEVLETLDLELLGPIESRGVHASKTKNLYKATLLIGNEELEIEVMGETYDSIGSRVIRHFRHYISGGRHVWLKGDYYDPSMSPKQRITPSQFTTVSSKSDQQHMVPETQQLPADVICHESGSSSDTAVFQSIMTESQHLPVKTNVRQASETADDEDSPSKRARLSEEVSEFVENEESCELSASSASSLYASPTLKSPLSSLHHEQLSSSHPSPVPTLISPLSSSSRSPSSEHTLPFPINEDDSNSGHAEILSND